MKKIYEAFLDQDKPKWISLSDIEKYKEKMEEKLKEHNFEEANMKLNILKKACEEFEIIKQEEM